MRVLFDFVNLPKNLIDLDIYNIGKLTGTMNLTQLPHTLQSIEASDCRFTNIVTPLDNITVKCCFNFE